MLCSKDLSPHRNELHSNEYIKYVDLENRWIVPAVVLFGLSSRLFTLKLAIFSYNKWRTWLPMLHYIQNLFDLEHGGDERIINW